MKIKDSIEQSVVTYTYIGSMTWLFESDMTKNFLNKLNLKPYSYSICSRKNGWSDFYDFGFWLDFLLSWSLDAFYALRFKILWIFKSLNIAPFLVLLWNCQNRTVQNKKSNSSIFSDLPNLIINTIMSRFIESDSEQWAPVHCIEMPHTHIVTNIFPPYLNCYRCWFFVLHLIVCFWILISIYKLISHISFFVIYFVMIWHIIGCHIHYIFNVFGHITVQIH
jgi:hypothetical protein